MSGRFGALPFTLRRSHDIVGREITMTEEVIHGVLRLSGDRLVIQWRVTRETSFVGTEIRTDSEIDPVIEMVVPLSSLASAQVRLSWWRWPQRVRLVLTAADLRAFESVAGAGGLKLEHPAELVVSVRRADRIAALDFAGELEMAIAERALNAAEEGERRLPAPEA